MKESKPAIMGLAGLIALAIVALIFFMTRQGETSSGSSVNENLAEMRKNTPAGLPKVSKEEAQQGMMLMGGGKKGGGGGSGPGLAPP